MDNINEELNLVKALGRAFEFVKAICDKISLLGGNDHAAWLIVKEPGYALQFAEVLMGKSKIVAQDPLTVISTTGRSDEVRALAALELTTDEDRLKVAGKNKKVIIEAALSKLEDKKKLYDWYLKEEQSEQGRRRHHSTWKIFFSYMNEADLFQIAMNHSWHCVPAVEAISNQNILKAIIETSEIGIGICTAVEKVDDFDYLQKLSQVKLQEGYSPISNLIKSIDCRMRELRNNQ